MQGGELKRIEAVMVRTARPDHFDIDQGPHTTTCDHDVACAWVVTNTAYIHHQWK